MNGRKSRLSVNRVELHRKATVRLPEKTLGGFFKVLGLVLEAVQTQIKV